ncbi:TIR domain-containing protein [Sphingomonas sp. ASV193]|uniref:TIR domain-containing protein n=1 Tax=Sphingomonas sp. ASV193 TaxID=3144405 RepID=UPI0032E8ABDB
MTEGRKPILFLSYAHADEARARRLANVLTSAGYQLWWDALIEGGAAFATSIEQALETADVVVVLWSAASAKSDWVRDEAARGRDRHRLVPLSLDGTLPPLGFRQYQQIDLSQWRGRRDKRIAAVERAIAAVIAGQVPSATAAPFVADRRASRRGVLLGGAAAGVALLGGGAWLANREGWFGADPPPSLAVVPFRDLGGAPDQRFLADGLTEQVRVALTRLPELQVLAATSSAKAAEQSADAKSIGHLLNVAWVLAGSVQRAGNRVRIVTELSDGATGFSRWTQSFDRGLDDIFAVESEIAGRVAEAMSVQIAVREAAPGGTRNADAYLAYTRGKALFDLAKDQASDKRALDYYELALAADPRFALAWAAKSRSLAAWANEYAVGPDMKPFYEQAIAAAEKAVGIAPGLAEAQLALGFAIYNGRLDAPAARPAYDRAYALGKGDADVALLFALYCGRTGRPGEAAQAAARAVLLDPLNARAFRAQGSVAYAARRYADALGPLGRALALNPAITYVHALQGFCLLGLGRAGEAMKAFAAEPQPMFRLSGLAIAQARSGDKAAATRSFEQLVAQSGDAAAYQQAEVLTALGRPDEAIAALARARAVGDTGLHFLATDPLLDPLRGDPRFVAFAREFRG